MKRKSFYSSTARKSPGRNKTCVQVLVSQDVTYHFNLIHVDLQRDISALVINIAQLVISMKGLEKLVDCSDKIFFSGIEAIHVLGGFEDPVCTPEVVENTSLQIS